MFHGPPQHGKSFLVSQRFPAYCLGVKPTLRVRLACYNITHATRFSKVNMDIMRSPEFARLFPAPACRIPAVCPADEWSTAARAVLLDANPSFKALGLGSGFVGMGVDCLIIDDPYKNRQEADSEKINANIWDWWESTVIPRMNPDTNVVVMFHRWREGDFAGRLLEQGGWEYYRYAAIGDGDNDPMNRPVDTSLSPRYPVPYLRAIEAKDPMTFVGLYQGKPTADQGNRFKVDMFCPPNEKGEYRADKFWSIDTLLSQPIREAYFAWDTAAKTKARNDYTAGGILAQAADGYLYLLPVFLDKREIADVERIILTEWAKWWHVLNSITPGCLKGAHVEEGASGGTAIVQSARRSLPEIKRIRDAWFAWNSAKLDPELFDWAPPVVWRDHLEDWKLVVTTTPANILAHQPDKEKTEVKAVDTISCCAGRSVRLIDYGGGNKYGAKAPYARQWLGQLLALPLGDHDDAVDSTIKLVRPYAGIVNGEQLFTQQEIDDAIMEE